MPRNDRSWFKRKVRDLGNALRRLPRSRQRALVDAIETETEPAPLTYPAHREGLVVPARPPQPGKGTFTPPEPYGVESDARQATGGWLDDEAGESGAGATEEAELSATEYPWPRKLGLLESAIKSSRRERPRRNQGQRDVE